METKPLIQKICSILEEKLCKDIVVLDLTEIHSFLSYFIISTANSNYHSHGVCQEVARSLKFYRKNNLNVKKDNSGWQILDYYDILVHIMTEDMRNLYNLEKLFYDGKRLSF